MTRDRRGELFRLDGIDGAVFLVIGSKPCYRDGIETDWPQHALYGHHERARVSVDWYSEYDLVCHAQRLDEGWPRHDGR